MAEDGDTVDLAELLGALTAAVARANHLGDLESVRLAELYAGEADLGTLMAPHFDIGSMQVTLRFAVRGLSDPEPDRPGAPGLQAWVSPEALGTLGAHQVSELVITLRSSPLRE